MHTRSFAPIAALSTLGIAVALYLTRLHLDLFYGAGVQSALCDFNANFSCSTVNGAPESELFGIPQAVLAIPTYLVVMAVAGAAWRTKRPAGAAIVGVIGLMTCAYSGYLAYVSAAVIGAWCLFCMVLYGVNLGITAIALGAARPLGEALRDARLPAWGGTALVSAVAFAVSLGGYEMVREKAANSAAEAVVAAPPAAAAVTTTSATETKKIKLAAKRQDVVAPADAPTRGPKAARITIVEFSDFQCPFCKRLQGTLHQIQEEYPADVRLAYAHFPMNTDCNRAPLKKSMHPAACAAAVASTCADKQGKFWEMHDWLFDHQGALEKATYMEGATSMSLDLGAFEACLADPATVETVAKQTEAGAALGVGGTPTFFVNGRQLSGGQPIEVLRAVVDAELAGNTGMLDLDVAVGTELTGTVSGPEQVTVAGVKIDAFEASMAGKRAQSKAGVATARAVSWFEARDACAAAGKRLCTEAEWQTACTGTTAVDADKDGIFANDPILGRKYGYGDVRKDGVCADSRNPEAAGDIVTGTHPRCGTPEGAYDMVGGVKEWVGLTADTAGLKGGSYSSGDAARCGYFRDDIAPETKDPANGFRCCEGPADVPEPVEGREVGAKLGDFTLPLVSGGELSTEALRGKPAILTFWASWCGPCKKELPILSRLYEAHKAEGLEVIGISVDADAGQRDAYLRGANLPFTIALDPGGKLLDTFTRRGVPTTLWLKRDGTLRLRTTGVPPGQDKRLEELVKELVAG